ncbi:MAG: hypothetical protein H8E47_13735 [Anaerolineales bacterium]|nr:hypothetical protein [Anaerolineales bacterium]
MVQDLADFVADEPIFVDANIFLPTQRRFKSTRLEPEQHSQTKEPHPQQSGARLFFYQR